MSLENYASYDVINMLLKAYPKAAEVKNYYGWLPLHAALNSEASPDVINMLLKAYPKASEVKNYYGWLPLHAALNNEASPDVINKQTQGLLGFKLMRRAL